LRWLPRRPPLAGLEVDFGLGSVGRELALWAAVERFSPATVGETGHRHAVCPSGQRRARPCDGTNPDGGASMNEEQIREFLYQALETELGGVQVYQTALQCVQNEELRDEWEEYLEQTEDHVRILQSVFERIELDPETETPGRKVVRHI